MQTLHQTKSNSHAPLFANGHQSWCTHLLLMHTTGYLYCLRHSPYAVCFSLSLFDNTLASVLTCADTHFRHSSALALNVCKDDWSKVAAQSEAFSSEQGQVSKAHESQWKITTRPKDKINILHLSLCLPWRILGQLGSPFLLRANTPHTPA